MIGEQLEKVCEHCGFELFEEEDRYCSDYCEGMAKCDLDEHKYKNMERENENG